MMSQSRALSTIVRRSAVARPVLRVPTTGTARTFQQGRALKKSGVSIVNAEEGTTKIHHNVNIALAVVAPLVFLAPAALAKPVDLTLGVLFPLHSHICMSSVIADYMHGSARKAARLGSVGLHAVMLLGLLRLNLSGPGISGLIKSLWKKPEKIEA